MQTRSTGRTGAGGNLSGYPTAAATTSRCVGSENVASRSGARPARPSLFQRLICSPTGARSRMERNASGAAGCPGFHSRRPGVGSPPADISFSVAEGLSAQHVNSKRAFPMSIKRCSLPRRPRRADATVTPKLPIIPLPPISRCRIGERDTKRHDGAVFVADFANSHG
jgi:hypothetical protein